MTMRKKSGSSRDQYWTCFWSIWNYLAIFSYGMTFPLWIWGKFNLNEKRQLLKNKVIWFCFCFCSTQAIKGKKAPLRIGFTEASHPFSVPGLLEVPLSLQCGKRCAAFLILWKHFQSPSFGMKVQVQLSIEKDTRSNMLKLPGDISSHLTPHPSKERVGTLPKELRRSRSYKLFCLSNYSSYSWGWGRGLKQIINRWDGKEML